MIRSTGILVATLMFAGAASAQQAAPQFPEMTFFISSTGGPDGGNFGGIEGADQHCQALGESAGAGDKTWRAYLSTQAEDGKPAINARDRIGSGPWQNAKGAQIAANIEELHDQTKVNINTETGVAENGRLIVNRNFVHNMHDILTGSTLEGRAFPAGEDMTCGNWTLNEGSGAQIGHFDRLSGGTTPEALSWNSSHRSRGCSYDQFRSSGGSGLTYCFAAN